jgi:hypothetical protein
MAVTPAIAQACGDDASDLAFCDRCINPMVWAGVSMPRLVAIQYLDGARIWHLAGQPTDEADASASGDGHLDRIRRSPTEGPGRAGLLGALHFPVQLFQSRPPGAGPPARGPSATFRELCHRHLLTACTPGGPAGRRAPALTAPPAPRRTHHRRIRPRRRPQVERRQWASSGRRSGRRLPCRTRSGRRCRRVRPAPTPTTRRCPFNHG